MDAAKEKREMEQKHSTIQQKVPEKLETMNYGSPQWFDHSFEQDSFVLKSTLWNAF